ncbi:hypothetical protein [Flavobacterium sp.]|uniref:hypothetical protein n=1 Tax=Flavobacterium sp. TaxID=239 RepID=UPI00286C35D2|nr:hypothetical protein [Flavobacterium sp.]
METRTDFIDRIKRICAVNITFDGKQKQYLINDVWADEIEGEYFKNDVYDLEDTLMENLRFVSRKREVIVELCELLQQKIAWYEARAITNLAFLDHIQSSVRELYGSVSKKDKFTAASILQCDDNDAAEVDEIIYTLKRFEEEFDFYKNEEHIGKVILLHALHLHYKSLKALCHFLLKLEKDVDTIDFDDLASSGAYLKTQRQLGKCTLKFDKITTSVFFSILTECDIIRMDHKESLNKIKIQKFIEENFNYTSDDGEVKPIHRINKENAKFNKGEYYQTQLKVLDQLIHLFEENKAYVKRINKIP